MDDFKIAQLTKELVASKLKTLEDPCAAAAGLVKETLAVALKGQPQGPGAAASIAEACKGGITGLLLAEQNLARGAVMLLEAVVDLASTCNFDTHWAMENALTGLSDVKRFATPDALQAIGKDIEARFMGAGAAFLELVRDALAAGPDSPSRS